MSSDTEDRPNIIIQDQKASRAGSERLEFSDIQFSEFLVEFIGNFCIVTSVYFSGGNTILTPAMVGLLITLFGPISGAHFNLAVTLLAPLVARHHNYPKPTVKKCILYFVAQASGSALANIFNCSFMGWDKLIKIAPGANMSIYSALGLELFLTFIVIFYTCVCCHPNAQRESYLNGLIFFVYIFTAATSAGQHCGALFNPTLALVHGSFNLIVKRDVHNFLVMLAYTVVQLAAMPIGFWVYKYLISDVMYPRGEIPSLKNEVEREPIGTSLTVKLTKGSLEEPLISGTKL